MYPIIMYMRVSTKRRQGKTYQYLQLCEAYRNEAGQPRTRVLINFGRMDQLDRKKIDTAVEALLAYSADPRVPRLSDLHHLRARDYGDMLALVHLWGRLRVAESIGRHLRGKRLSFDVAEMVKVMVLNRLSDPMSKLGIMRWLPTVLIPELREEAVSYPHLLRAMDYLVQIKERIELDLYNELVTLFNLEVDLVFFDLTSCYFEGEGPEMADWGYSRDRRPDRKQIVLAVAITREGLPIYHEVLPGSTADVTTLRPAVEVLRSRFRVGRCILVCDRGMVSEENLAYLDEVQTPYIVAIRRRGTRESDALIGKSLRGFVQMDRLLVKEKTRGDVRYILCHNPEVAESKRRTREQLLQKVQKEIDTLNRRFQNGKLSRDMLYHRALRVLEDHHLDHYFSPQLEKPGIILYFNTDTWERERFLEGTFFLKTRLSPEEFSTADLVRTYKMLQEIERAFRELKDFLKIRPIFHWTDRRVKAHVMICVLAYLLEKMVGLHCERAKVNLSPRRTLSVLSQLKAIDCRLAEQSLQVTTVLHEEMKRIMQALGMPLPGKVIGNQIVH